MGLFQICLGLPEFLLFGVYLIRTPSLVFVIILALAGNSKEGARLVPPQDKDFLTLVLPT
jgi:hypothetical protein